MTVTLYALVMAFGVLVAAIGLVLLFRKHEESLSRIRILNQEFQFSAPGLVVLLAGCVLIVLFPVLGVNDKDVIVIGSGPNDGIHRDGGVVIGGSEIRYLYEAEFLKKLTKRFLNFGFRGKAWGWMGQVRPGLYGRTRG